MKHLATTFLVLLLGSAVALADNLPKAEKGNVTVPVLLSPKSQEMVGELVKLWYQPVQVKTRHEAFWIGPNEDEMVLVTMPPTVHVLNEDGEPVKLREGDYVQVEAIIVRAPNEYQLRKGWGVNQDDLFLIERAGVILLAQSVKLIARRD